MAAGGDRLDALIRAGVVIEDPSTVRVGPAVRIEPKAVLRPFTILEGTTSIGAAAMIGPFARLENATIGPRAQVLDHCVLCDCTVEAAASVGPFTHIRPQTQVGEGAKVGNFVELKKTVLGKGSKASHLSYLGDATIGEKVNIGAGTITCNYDGFVKNPTRIEDGVFVGSNSTLVAPLTLGARSYVAAGSVLTEDVPEDALALGRSRQTVKPERARVLRERGAAKKAQKHG